MCTTPRYMIQIHGQKLLTQQIHNSKNRIYEQMLPIWEFKLLAWEENYRGKMGINKHTLPT
jgi:hypothetical protein